MTLEKLFDFLFDNNFKHTEKQPGFHSFTREIGWEQFEIIVNVDKSLIVVQDASWSKHFLDELHELVDEDFNILSPYYE